MRQRKAPRQRLRRRASNAPGSIKASMPLFFFEFFDGHLIEDDVGHELPDLQAARREAILSARSIIWDEVAHGHLPLGESIRILDSNREVLAVVDFREAVETSRQPGVEQPHSGEESSHEDG